MTCADCTLAAKQEWHGFSAGCRGCAARSVARGPHYRRVRDAGKLDRAYRDALMQFGVTHEDVKAAAWLDAKTEGTLQL